MPKNELVSLALVHSEPMHAYGINAVVKETEIESWARISPASIYNSLSKLERDGCVSVRAEKVGNMPERKVYSITDTGTQRLRKEVEDALLSLDFGEHPFYVGVTFAFGFEAAELIQILKRRIEVIQQAMSEMEEEYKHLEEYRVSNSMISVRAGIKHMQVEMETAQDLIQLLKKEPGFYGRLAQMYRCLGAHKAGEAGADSTGKEP